MVYGWPTYGAVDRIWSAFEVGEALQSTIANTNYADKATLEEFDFKIRCISSHQIIFGIKVDLFTTFKSFLSLQPSAFPFIYRHGDIFPLADFGNLNCYISIISIAYVCLCLISVSFFLSFFFFSPPLPFLCISVLLLLLSLS